MVKNKSVRFIVSFPFTMFQLMERERKRIGVKRSEFIRRKVF